MTPNVKRWDMIFRISVLLAIGCMVTAGGCSKSPGGLLTVEIAEQFLADNDSVRLQQFTSIEDAAAEALAKHKGALMLEGLTSISDAAAAALGNHDSNLNLGGLTSISDAQAEAFAKHQGGYLALYGLTELSDDAAEALAKYDGRLSVDHDQLPPSASKILKDAGH